MQFIRTFVNGGRPEEKKLTELVYNCSDRFGSILLATQMNHFDITENVGALLV